MRRIEFKHMTKQIYYLPIDLRLNLHIFSAIVCLNDVTTNLVHLFQHSFQIAMERWVGLQTFAEPVVPSFNAVVSPKMASKVH